MISTFRETVDVERKEDSKYSVKLLQPAKSPKQKRSLSFFYHKIPSGKITAKDGLLQLALSPKLMEACGQMAPPFPEEEREFSLKVLHCAVPESIPKKIRYIGKRTDKELLPDRHELHHLKHESTRQMIPYVKEEEKGTSGDSRSPQEEALHRPVFKMCTGQDSQKPRFATTSAAALPSEHQPSMSPHIPSPKEEDRNCSKQVFHAEAGMNTHLVANCRSTDAENGKEETPNCMDYSDETPQKLQPSLRRAKEEGKDYCCASFSLCTNEGALKQVPPGNETEHAVFAHSSGTIFADQLQVAVFLSQAIPSEESKVLCCKCPTSFGCLDSIRKVADNEDTNMAGSMEITHCPFTDEKPKQVVASFHKPIDEKKEEGANFADFSGHTCVPKENHVCDEDEKATESHRTSCCFEEEAAFQMFISQPRLCQDEDMELSCGTRVHIMQVQPQKEVSLSEETDIVVCSEGTYSVFFQELSVQILSPSLEVHQEEEKETGFHCASSSLSAKLNACTEVYKAQNTEILLSQRCLDNSSIVFLEEYNEQTMPSPPKPNEEKHSSQQSASTSLHMHEGRSSQVSTAEEVYEALESQCAGSFDLDKSFAKMMLHFEELRELGTLCLNSNDVWDHTRESKVSVEQETTCFSEELCLFYMEEELVQMEQFFQSSDEEQKQLTFEPSDYCTVQPPIQHGHVVGAVEDSPCKVVEICLPVKAAPKMEKSFQSSKEENKELTFESSDCMIQPAIKHGHVIGTVQDRPCEVVEMFLPVEAAPKEYEVLRAMFRNLSSLFYQVKKTDNFILREAQKGSIALCFDVSGSMTSRVNLNNSNMAYSKLDVVKAELQNILYERLHSHQLFAVIKFNKDVTQCLNGLISASTDNLEKTAKQVQLWCPQEGTSFWIPPLETAYSLDGISAVYFVSDGVPQEEENLVISRILELNGKRKIPCHTTAFSCSEAGKSILKKMAESTAGSFLAVDFRGPKLYTDTEITAAAIIQRNVRRHLPQCFLKINYSVLRNIFWEDIVNMNIKAKFHTNFILRDSLAQYSTAALCIDTSWSMNWVVYIDEPEASYTRFDILKAELADALSGKFKHQHKFMLMKFNTDVEQWSKELLPVSETNINNALEHVKRWRPKGRTCYVPPLEAAFRVEGIQAVYFVSDGEPFEEEDDVMQCLLKLGKYRNIPCHTTAFGATTAGKNILQKMAEVTGGSFLAIDVPFACKVPSTSTFKVLTERDRTLQIKAVMLLQKCFRRYLVRCHRSDPVDYANVREVFWGDITVNIQINVFDNFIVRDTQKGYDNVVLCVDTSGSMGWKVYVEEPYTSYSRMDIVNAEVIDVFSQKLLEHQTFTVIKFDSAAFQCSKSLVKVSSLNVNKFLNDLHSWKPKGGTSYIPALEAAFRMTGVNAVYFLSDGEPSENPDLVIRRIKELSKNGEIVCHTTAFGASNAGIHILQKMAEVTGGTFTSINVPFAACLTKTLNSTREHQTAILHQAKCSVLIQKMFRRYLIRRHRIGSKNLRTFFWKISSAYNNDTSKNYDNFILHDTDKEYETVVLCICTTESMRCTVATNDSEPCQLYSRLDVVKAELENVFLNKLCESQKFTLINFHTQAHVWPQGVVQASQKNLRSAMHHINCWKPQGGISYIPAIEAAFQVEGSTAIYFLANGEPSESKEWLLQQIQKLCQGRKVKIHTTAFGASEMSKQVLCKMAEITGGTFLGINLPPTAQISRPVHKSVVLKSVSLGGGNLLKENAATVIQKSFRRHLTNVELLCQKDYAMLRCTFWNHPKIRVQIQSYQNFILRETRYDCFALYIDTSGMMDYTVFEDPNSPSSPYLRLDIVKAELQDVFFRRVSPTQQFSVIRFDEKLEHWHCSNFGGCPQNLRKAMTYIQHWDPEGKTSNSHIRPLEAAFKLVGVKAVYFISDASSIVGDEIAFLRRIKELSLDGQIPCHTTAFGATSAGKHLLRQMSEITRGSYLAIDLPHDEKRYFNHVVTSIRSLGSIGNVRFEQRRTRRPWLRRFTAQRYLFQGPETTKEGISNKPTAIATKEGVSNKSTDFAQNKDLFVKPRRTGFKTWKLLRSTKVAAGFVK